VSCRYLFARLARHEVHLTHTCAYAPAPRYAQVFEDVCIDGESLLQLNEWRLTQLRDYESVSESWSVCESERGSEERPWEKGSLSMSPEESVPVGAVVSRLTRFCLVACLAQFLSDVGMKKAGHVLKLGWKLKALTAGGWTGVQPHVKVAFESDCTSKSKPTPSPKPPQTRQRVASGPDGSAGFALVRTRAE
jgi:hypothetical protein